MVIAKVTIPTRMYSSGVFIAVPLFLYNLLHPTAKAVRAKKDKMVTATTSRSYKRDINFLLL